MAEKKTEDKTDQINVQPEKSEDTNKMTEKGTNTEKTASVAVPMAPPAPAPRPAPTPLFTKAPPNDLYRKLLPAALFLLTFVTVMTLLLIYMDSVALGAQQFRLNMSRDYELDIPQDSPMFLNYLRQRIVSPKEDEVDDEPIPEMPESVKVLDTVFGPDYVGSFAEILPAGARRAAGVFLQRVRGWRPLLVRAAPRDYLTLRAVRKLHACLAEDRPREVAYQEPSPAAASFSSRVLCAPLYSLLAAADGAQLALAVLPRAGLAALQHAPPHALRIEVIELVADAAARAAAAEQLRQLRYQLLAELPDSALYRRANDTAAAPAAP